MSLWHSHAAEKLLAAWPDSLHCNDSQMQNARWQEATKLTRQAPMRAAPQTLCLILFLHASCGWSALRAQTSATPADEADREQKQTQQMEKKERAETWRLATSSKPEDRIEATERLSYLFMDYDLLWKLMNDPQPGVHVAAIFALSNISCTVNTPLSLEMAQKMAAFLEKKVTEERIKTAFEGGKNGYEINLVCGSALGLDLLFQSHPLKGTPSNYKSWQESVPKYLVLCLSHLRNDKDGGDDPLMYEMLKLIRDPGLLSEALPWALESLDDRPAARQLAALQALWAHPLLGEYKPMNLVLLKELAPVWESVRDHILHNIPNENDKMQASLLLNRINEAFAQARKQLGAQPARNAKK